MGERNMPGIPFDPADAVRILGGTPDTLEALFRQIPESWTLAHEGGDTWSPFDVLGHLIHGDETDWIPRARWILAEGTSRPFEPFDRLAQFETSKGKTTAELLVTFRALRGANLQELRDLLHGGPDLDAEGAHPAFGTVTLRQLLSTWVVHDLGHIAQICRVLCAQYGEEVGPWREYLPILQRPHTASD